eukprot:6118092-Heterocapsa_arctica.AAC.1
MTRKKRSLDHGGLGTLAAKRIWHALREQNNGGRDFQGRGCKPEISAGRRRELGPATVSSGTASP